MSIETRLTDSEKAPKVIPKANALGFGNKGLVVFIVIDSHICTSQCGGQGTRRTQFISLTCPTSRNMKLTGKLISYILNIPSPF